MKKFYIITTNGLDEQIDVMSEEFENENEVWNYIEEAGHNYDSHIVMSEEKFLNLLKQIITDENIKKIK